VTAPTVPALATAETLPEILHADFLAARRSLLRAKADRRVRDDLPNRKAVTDALAKLDSILDAYLALH
jgi:hypothetical protein